MASSSFKKMKTPMTKNVMKKIAYRLSCPYEGSITSGKFVVVRSVNMKKNESFKFENVSTPSIVPAKRRFPIHAK
jgi:hypothetical protein